MSTSERPSSVAPCGPVYSRPLLAFQGPAPVPALFALLTKKVKYPGMGELSNPTGGVTSAPEAGAEITMVRPFSETKSPSPAS